MIWLHELGQIFQRWRSTKKNRVKTPGEGLFGKIFTEIELKWVFNIQEIFDLMDFLHIVCDPTLVRMGPEWWRWWWQGTWMGSKGAGHSCQFWAGTKITLSSVLGAGRGKLCNLRHEFHAMLFPRTSSARLVHRSPLLCAVHLPCLCLLKVTRIISSTTLKKTISLQYFVSGTIRQTNLFSTVYFLHLCYRPKRVNCNTEEGKISPQIWDFNFW